MHIPLVDLKAQYDRIATEMDEAMAEVIRTTSFIGGPAVKSFETDWARYCHASHAVGLSSGTSALHLALLMAGVGPGDEVLTVSHTFIATAEIVRRLGATVRFVEVDPETYTMDPSALEAAMNPKVRAIVPVHLYGHPADMDPILEIGRRYGVRVIEDAAQAHGAGYKGRIVGSLASLATFSFYPGKNLGAYGDAGAVTAASAEEADRMRRISNHGRAEKYLHDVEGFNYRLDSLQAAVLNVKLKHLDQWTAERRRAAAQYSERLARVAGVTLPKVASWAEPVWHLYVVLVKDRDRVLGALRAEGIDAGVHYPVPLHLQPAYAHLRYRRGEFPVTERAADSCLSLPLFAEITEAQIEQVSVALARAL